MEKNNSVISKLCPRCHGCMLEFYENEKHVTCYACDESIPVRELLESPTVAPVVPAAVAERSVTAFGSGAVMNLMTDIDSPESGLIYLENFFANYDWDAYKKSSIILIENLETMVEKNKIRQGASANSWLLDFQSVSLPLAKKLEGRNELENKMADLYNEEDNAGILPIFDRHKEITHSLIANREGLLKRLENDIAFAQKLGLAEDKLNPMKDNLEKLTGLMNGLAMVSAISEIPAVIRMKKKINEKMILKYREQGIDAEDVYRRACEIYDDPSRDRKEALRLFESIRGYSDSVEYIDRINAFFGYEGKFFYFFNHYYVFKTKELHPILDPTAGKKKKKKKKDENEEQPEETNYEGRVYQLHEVINKEPAENPIVKNITEIITFYGSRLYYVKLGKVICSYDMVTGMEIELCRGKKGDLKIFNEFGSVYSNATGTSLFIRKRLELEILTPGCVKKFFGKKETIVERKNNYAVYEINLAENICCQVIDHVVDISAQHDEYLFYTVAKEDEEQDEKGKLTLMTLNTSTYEKKQVLSENCEINAVSGSKVVYTLYAPNVYNMDLHVYDILTDSDTVIETNIYDFFRVIGDRVYYYVGNRKYRPLFSNNFEGTDRVEIMTRVENIVAVMGGWMYVVKGKSRNALLIKMSVDGKQRVTIGSQIKRIVKITDSFLYYIDYRDVLRVVRTDGKDNKPIAGNLDADNVIVDLDHIYYLRRERVTDSEKNYESRSLYVMDTDGHNVRKLLFNVLGMKNYDDNILYIEKADRIRYHIRYPAKRKRDEREETRTFRFTRYYKFDKAECTFDNFLNIGFPHPSKYESRGCIGKGVEMESIFTEVPIKPEYEHKGAEAGEAQIEQIVERELEKDANANENAVGCFGGKR